VVGVVEVDMWLSQTEKHRRPAIVGIVIHHPFAGERYGKEALVALFDYAFLCKAEIHGTHATGLELDEIVLDTEMQNVHFVSRMASLGLGELRKESKRVDVTRPQVKYSIWTLKKKFWKQNRGNVQLGWLKPPMKLEKKYLGGFSSVKDLSLGSGSQSGHQSGLQGYHQAQHHPDQPQYRY